MSIMNAFRNMLGGSAPQQPQGAQPQVNPAASQQLNNTVGSEQSNNTVPSATTLQSDGKTPAIPAAAQGDQSPLANYSDLWKAPENGTGLPSTVPTITVDPAKLDSISKNVDFTKAVDKTLVAKAVSGDAEALMQVLSQAAQAGFAQAAGTSAQMIQKAMSLQDERLQQQYIPEVLRRTEISRQMRTDNNLYSDPAIAPMLNMVETQFAAKYPQASPQEIRQSAMNYLQQTASAVVKQSGKQVIDTPQASPASKQRDVDWEGFFME